MRILNAICIIVFGVLLYSCAIFEEKPVTNEVITITSPANLSTVTSLSVTFIWSEIQNSTPFKYNIQVASPNFETPSFFAVDTNTTKIKYSKTLIPGIYACRVRAFNGSTQSQYTTINFVVDTAKKITGFLTLSAPNDGFKSKSKNVALAWNTVLYAAKYQVQVFSLDSTGIIIERKLDTLTTSTKLSFRSDPGFYLWQVKALNTTSTTDYVSRKFNIDTINSISSETTVLLSPSDNIYSKTKTQTFKWQTIKYANTYKLEIAFKDFNQASNIFYSNSSISKDTITTQLPLDGKYQWRVTGSNVGGSSATSAARTITIITAIPSTPSLISPTQNFTATSGIVQFSWSKSQNTTDSLFILKSDSVTIIKSIGQSAPSGVSLYNDQFTTGKYFWKVKSTDLAGNTSSFSIVQKFYVP